MSVPFGSMLHIPLNNYDLLAPKQESYQKAYLLTKNTEEFSGEKWEEQASRQKGEKTIQKEQWE